MIISHSRKFIFIKTAKTAGTSLEIALSRYCARGDVITPITAEDEAIRRRLGHLGPRNFRKSPLAATRRDVKRLLMRREFLMKYYNHMPATEARAMLPGEIWRSYFKFTICRDPWTRMVSTYRWNRRNMPKAEDLSFHEFLFEHPDRIRLNWRLYTDKDDILVDDVVKFEALEEGLARISARIGLPENVYGAMRTIRAKDAAAAGPKTPAAAQISAPTSEPIMWRDDDIALVALLAAPEIERFGYTPPR